MGIAYIAVIIKDFKEWVPWDSYFSKLWVPEEINGSHSDSWKRIVPKPQFIFISVYLFIHDSNVDLKINTV